MSKLTKFQKFVTYFSVRKLTLLRGILHVECIGEPSKSNRDCPCAKMLGNEIKDGAVKTMHTSKVQWWTLWMAVFVHFKNYSMDCDMLTVSYRPNHEFLVTGGKRHFRNCTI